MARLRLLPADRAPAGEFGDESRPYPVEVRDDGIYVGVEPLPAHVRTVSDVMAETMVAWGVRHVFGMVGHSNLGLADAIRRRVEARRLEYIGIRTRARRRSRLRPTAS